MYTYMVIVQSAILTVLCEDTIPVTNNFRDKIALEVLKISPVNTVVSALALKFPLCKLTAIAKGDAKTELMSALGMDKEKKINCFKELRYQLHICVSSVSDLMMHNRIYLNDSLEADAAFTNNSFDEYGVRIGRVGFRYPKAAAKFMNRFVASETLNRVSTLIDDDDIDNNTSMVILNGLYFKSHWEYPFDIRFTDYNTFRDENNTVSNIPMMVKVGNFHYADEVNYDVKLLRLPFISGLSILFVRPGQRNGLPALLEKLSSDPTLIEKLRKKMADTYVKFYVPRMKIKTYVDWTDFLRLIGINKILDTDSRPLDGILKNGTSSEIPVHLSKAKQKVFFDLDELGLTRHLPSAALAYNLEREAMELRLSYGTVDFILDQPFYFVVSWKSDGQEHELFNGVFRKPEAILRK